MISTKRRQPLSREGQIPDMGDMLESGWIKRCGVCWRLWDAGHFTIEEGARGTEERCPSCIDERTETQKANKTIEETAYAATREPRPQVSIAPLASTFPGTIVSIYAAFSVRVYSGRPLRLLRNVATALYLVGRSFSSADTITGPAGLTLNVSARTAVLTTLSVTAGLSMTPGDRYGITFNLVDFNNIFSVR